MYIRLIIAIISVISVFAFSDSEGKGPEVFLDLKTAGSGRIEVAVPDFTVGRGRSGAYIQLTSTMSRVVRADLEFSGFFKVIDKDGFVQEQEREDRAKGKTNFSEWGALGAVALLKGEIYMDGGQLVLKSELFDVDRGKRIIGVKYSGDPRDYRTIAHRLSEEIAYRLTGEKGVFRSKIAFVSKQRQNKEMYIMDYDGHGVYRLTGDKSLVLSPAWSPDGKRIAFTSYIDNNPDLYIINQDGLDRRALSLAQGLNVLPAWSPDGKNIAMVMTKDGNAEIYLIRVKDGKLKRLTKNRVTDSGPAWSPNGKRIAFTSSRAGFPQIHVMDADGKNAKRITYLGDYNDQASWSPRGDRLAFAGRRDELFNIYTINLDGSDLKRLTKDAGNNEAPAWSPDGRHIAFSSDRNGTPQIYIMGVDGSGQHPVTKLAGGGYSPAWSTRLGD